MKIIHVFNELKFSGAEILYADAAPIFKELGCELTALSTAQNVGVFAPVLKEAGYKILHKKYPNRKQIIKRILFYIKFIKFLKINNYDLVHIHRNDAMWGISLCALFANKKAIYTFHNVFPSNKLSYIYNYTLRWTAKRILKCKFQTISDSVYENELNYYHNSTEKIYNWYGDNRFYPKVNNEKEKFRNELNLSLDSLVLISIGGCNHVKRHSDILKALPIIIEKYPNCTYLHLGEGVTEKEELDLARKLGVEKNIRFCKNQVSVRKYLIASDLYLMPSKYEGIPITTIEAMGSGIPSILYDVPGLKDFNKSGENSLLIPEDFKILAEKILYLHENPSLATKLSKNAKIFVDTNFNMKTNSTKIFELYKSIFSK
jgi:glycosyltransferase involved in cell wall biosynthesis